VSLEQRRAPGGGLRSALVVALPEAAQAVDDWRERTCADRPSAGVPPHVTILFPFVPAAELGAGTIDRMHGLFARFPAFDVVLRELRRFPGVLNLAPEPDEPFRRLIEAAAAAYPERPPYGGEIPLDEVVPHVTVAQGDPALLDVAEADVAAALPIASPVREVVLLEEVEPDWERWRVRAAVPLGRRAP